MQKFSSSQMPCTHRGVATAGDKCLVALYEGDETTDTLNDVRFRTFVKTAANAKANLARLLSTTEAASYHHYRTYHQVQNRKAPAPPELLKLLSCKCKKGCRGGCTCLKAGFKCSVMCATCYGETCQNAAHIIIEEDDVTQEKPNEPQDNHDAPPMMAYSPMEEDDDDDPPIVGDMTDLVDIQILPPWDQKLTEKAFGATGRTHH
ncbi:unnamed protein product [Phaedon cochleariae]|uniref:Tesmin/TSO1-like CXC domain-containing protein n=1 Tax=Phaedon cochleariae TaxID=80249 RepID=A0A9N9SHV9_PHACE|nr:unnamed protein product [Phaedon cochleariae]